MKKIFIMGASSGIGLGLAEAFASRGVRVALAARRIVPLQKLKQRYPDNVVYDSIDVTHSDAPERMNALIKEAGGMDIYIHVAGVGFENPGLDPEIEAKTVEVNATGFARMISASYDYFRSNGGKGRIVAITSVAGTNGIAALSAYSASKTFDSTYLVALEQLSNLQGLDIKFTDIRPGWIRTPLLNDDKKYPMEMTMEEALPLIIKAIVRHPRVAYIGWRWKLLVKAWALVPDSIWIRMNPDIDM